MGGGSSTAVVTSIGATDCFQSDGESGDQGTFFELFSVDQDITFQDAKDGCPEQGSGLTLARIDGDISFDQVANLLATTGFTQTFYIGVEGDLEEASNTRTASMGSYLTLMEQPV